MSTTTKKTAAQGVRYTDAQKKEVVDFALSYNAANGRGGQSKAASKFKISPITIASWLKAAGSPKAAKATKVAKAPKAAKVAKAAKAPKTKKAKSKGKVGTRYTPGQKQEVLDFVASYNAANGRGGQSNAASKFGISPLTVMAWLKASGSKGSAKKSAKSVTKATKAVSTSSSNTKLDSLLALSKEIAKAESALAQLVSKRRSLVASL